MPAARAFLRSCLSEWLPEAVDVAELCMSELATNAVLHARTDFEASVRVAPGRALLQVRDFSAALPRQVLHSERATTGRGLDLVNVLAVDWGADQCAESGKVVWCELSADPPPAAADDEAGLLAMWGDDDLQDVPAVPARPAGRVALLLRYPVALWLQQREQLDALLRECVLLSEAASRGEGSAPERLVRLAEHVASRFPTVSERADRDRLAALRRGEETVDLEYPMPEGTEEVLVEFRDTLEALDAYAGRNDLLIMQTPEPLRRLRDWSIEQLLSQMAGAPPVPWDGPLR
ncbi:ATP-binding protein [Motilibacter sp. K478]|nr:ATP-binding protein [Motilibacter aurantiacus]NHC44921.1 ATP-binding protein [Motilibacter aurantiacus]